MYLAKVIGTVVATTKTDGLEGVKFLVVTPVDEAGQPNGAAQVAADAVQAGIGEIVYVCTGREGAMALDEPFVPVDLAVVGHVDDVDARLPGVKAPAPQKGIREGKRGAARRRR
jgi:ethanolamine utilization protein EutN